MKKGKRLDQTEEFECIGQHPVSVYIPGTHARHPTDQSDKRTSHSALLGLSKLLIPFSILLHLRLGSYVSRRGKLWRHVPFDVYQSTRLLFLPEPIASSGLGLRPIFIAYPQLYAKHPKTQRDSIAGNNVKWFTATCAPNRSKRLSSAWIISSSGHVFYSCPHPGHQDV